MNDQANIVSQNSLSRCGELKDPIKLKIHMRLFDHFREEAMFHKSKIKYFITLLLSVCATVFIYHNSKLFYKGNSELAIIIGVGIILLGIYYGLYHHVISLMHMCMNRDHEEWHIRKELGEPSSKEDLNFENLLARRYGCRLGTYFGIIFFVLITLIISLIYGFNLWETGGRTEAIVFTIYLILWLAITAYTCISAYKLHPMYIAIFNGLKNIRAPRPVN